MDYNRDIQSIVIEVGVATGGMACAMYSAIEHNIYDTGMNMVYWI